MTKRQAAGRRTIKSIYGERGIDLASLIIEDDEERSAAEDEEKEPLPYLGREEDTTVLAYGTTFKGDIKTRGHLEIAGTLLGDAMADKNIIVSGKVEGSVSGDCISLQKCAVRGDVCAKCELTIEDGTVVSGDVQAHSIALGGKVCGNVKAVGALVLQTDAYVMGDIEADTITMQEGCALFGGVEVLSKEKERLTREEFDTLIDTKV